MPSFGLVVIIVIFAICFDFINGFHDTANAIATSVSTRVLTPGQAILMSAVLNFIGSLTSTSVAKTVGADIVSPSSIPQTVVLAALIGAIIWNLIIWYFGIPSSSSHALIGGLIGAAVVASGTIYIVNWINFLDKVLIWLFLSPVIGFIAGYIIMVSLNWILRKSRPASVTRFFSKAQIVSAALMAFNHGSNDAQKTMGIITMACGTSIGGWKIIKTMGMNMAKLAPVNGFAAETGAAAVIFTATMLHAPVSTTHIISGSIMGVGASKRLSSVKWTLAETIVWTWVLTIPACIIMSALVMSLLKLI